MLNGTQEGALRRFAAGLVDQAKARIVVPANDQKPGFWFGGGNMIQLDDGSLHIVGRFRNAGDSRTGVASGERGLELAIFSSSGVDSPFEKAVSLTKSDLNIGDRQVLSIEGTALHRIGNQVELFVSTEKDGVGYPNGFEGFLKPGTGVWTIERLVADSIPALKDSSLATVAECRDPNFIHVKDPFVYDAPGGELVLLYCTHPFCWSSSNTAFQVREAGTAAFGEANYNFFPRGVSWDVAMTRGTCVLDIPQVGKFASESVSLVFYDGGECVRDLDQHKAAVTRPRGYSCEELGGAAYCPQGNLAQLSRLSVYEPMFISPHGTGCSRYVSVCRSADGFVATWQQSQPDGSQPLVMNYISHDEAASLLS